MGVGILIGVAGLRWSVGEWEKAKQRFWVNWERAGEGLTRDLTVRLLFTILNPRHFYSRVRQVMLDKKFEEHVASVPIAVCEQLEILEKIRLEGQIDTLLLDSENLHSS